jgi:hypothetical protein
MVPQQPCPGGSLQAFFSLQTPELVHGVLSSPSFTPLSINCQHTVPTSLLCHLLLSLSLAQSPVDLLN